MKKSELVQLFAAAKTTINHLRDNLYLLRDLNALRQLESEERLLQKVLSFQLTPGFNEKDNEDEVKFSEFIQSTNFTDLSLKLKEEGQLARICHLWLKDQIADQCTFMGTEITKIPLKNLVYLDGSYFDITEILPFMVSQQADGKKIFQNPASTARASFSQESISILVNHSVTNAFLTSHASEEARLDIQRSQLPDRFFDLLHEYLLALCEIGKNSTPAGNWGFFTEASVQQCDEARQTFFTKIDQEISIEHRLVLSKIKIYAPLKVGGTEDVAYSNVVEGSAGYDCVISQQIYLWSFLRERRPEIIVPSEISKHWQASRYDLGDNEAISQNTLATNNLPIHLEQFFQHQTIQETFLNLQNQFEREREERQENLSRTIREAMENLFTPMQRQPNFFEESMFNFTNNSSQHNRNFNSFFTPPPPPPPRNWGDESQLFSRTAVIESALREQDGFAPRQSEVTNHLRLNVTNHISSNQRAQLIVLLQNNNLSVSRENNERLALVRLGLNHSNQNRRSSNNDEGALDRLFQSNETDDIVSIIENLARRF